MIKMLTTGTHLAVFKQLQKTKTEKEKGIYCVTMTSPRRRQWRSSQVVDGSRDREHHGTREWCQSNEETMANRLVLAPPPNGHRRLAGDEKSAAVRRGRCRCRRRGALRLDSFGSGVEEEPAELLEVSSRLGTAGNYGESAADMG